MLQFTKETKTTLKVGNYKISENFVWKPLVPKARKPTVKTIVHKFSLSSIRRRNRPVLIENKQKC